MNINVYNSILTFNKQNNTTLVLSTDNSEIVLPHYVAQYAKYFREEILSWTKNLFKDLKSNDVLLIDYSFLEIQNRVLLDYVESIKSYNYNPDNDFCIFVGIIVGSKLDTNLHWLSLDQTTDIIAQKPIDNLIEYTIKHMII